MLCPLEELPSSTELTSCCHTVPRSVVRRKKQQQHRSSLQQDRPASLPEPTTSATAPSAQYENIYQYFNDCKTFGLQCFDAVGWVSGGHPARKNLTDEVLAWLSSAAKCK